MPDIRGGLLLQVEDEIRGYLTETTQISEGYDFSQAKLVKRISMFENRLYPTGKFDSQGNYKYWYDIITPRIHSEIKNVDFDSKDVTVEPPPNSGAKYDLLCLITNLKLREWMRNTGQSEEINSAIEEGAGWGNIVWKRVKGGYERVDIRNIYIINQTAKCLEETPVIERHQLSQTELLAYEGTYKNIQEVIDNCKSDRRSATQETQGKDTTVPYYDIYERNGEVCVRDLKEAKGESVSKGDDKKFTLARVIVAASNSEQTTSPKIEYILFSDEITKMPYEEYHRGRYKGRWFREGLYELLFDIQVRSNQIGNQIAQGLEWASKTFFFSNDKILIQNVLSDMANGDVLKAQSIAQVPVRMEGLDQLIAEWNRLIQLANDVANSQEVVQGINPPSGTPLGTTRLLDLNAGKLYDFIREKLAIPLTKIFERWIISELILDIKAQDVLALTGDSTMMERLQNMIVDDWYLRNLIEIGPHTKEIADTLKLQKLDELKKRPNLLMQGLQKSFEGFRPRASVVITGENSSMEADLKSLGEFISLEVDPVRRSALIEIAMRRKGIDIAGLPKTPPVQVQPNQPAMQPVGVK